MLILQLEKYNWTKTSFEQITGRNFNLHGLAHNIQVLTLEVTSISTLHSNIIFKMFTVKPNL